MEGCTPFCGIIQHCVRGVDLFNVCILAIPGGEGGGFAATLDALAPTPTAIDHLVPSFARAATALV